jgi:VCBS repeat-containing protein
MTALHSVRNLSAALAAFVILATPAVANWDPIGSHDIYIRNNTRTPYKIESITQIAYCIGSPAISYPSGSANIAVAPGATVEIIDTNGACITGLWKVSLGPSSSSARYSIYLKGTGNMGISYSNLKTAAHEVSASTSGLPHALWLMAESAIGEDGAYITIGANYFGELGPARSTSDVNTLTLTTFNTNVGGPDGCTRGQWQQSVLKTLDADVLALEELNEWGSSCNYDGHELAAYLWTGVGDSSKLTGNSYTNSSSGTGTSPNGGGSFPYISQFLDGLADDGDEHKTGGVAILSKLPLEMIANVYFQNRTGDWIKGFVLAKITKTAGSATRVYYVAATHTYAFDDTVRKAQLKEIRSKIDQLVPAGSRVIVMGDLNCAVHASAVNDAVAANKYANANTVCDPETYLGSLAGSTIMGSQTNTTYYPYSRDGRKLFYTMEDGGGSKPGGVHNIDYVLPVTKTTAKTFTAPILPYRWWVHPMRYAPFKYAELADHFPVSAVLQYGAPTLTGGLTGSVTEDDAVSTSTGTIQVSDNTPLKPETIPGSYGKLVVTSSSTGGSWRYIIDNTKTAVQALGAGKTATDPFTVYTNDNAGSAAVKITVTGVNDPATISGPPGWFGVVEDSVLSVSGQLKISDVDSGEAIVRFIDVDSSYGKFIVLPNGDWEYFLFNSSPAVQDLDYHEARADNFTVTSKDGSATFQVRIVVAGTNN